VDTVGMIVGMIDLNRNIRSESESAEEEFSVSGLLVLLGVGKVPEGVAEGLSEALPEGFSGLLGLEVVVLDVLEVELVDQEAGGQHVVLVYVLHEGLHTGLLDEFLLAVGALHLRHVAGDAGNQQMRESMLLNRLCCTLFPSS
jgi:hypothetical protein